MNEPNDLHKDRLRVCGCRCNPLREYESFLLGCQLALLFAFVVPVTLWLAVAAIRLVQGN